MKEGLIFTSTVVVTNENCALNVGSGSLLVFATPSLVALMENAAMQAVAPYLPVGANLKIWMLVYSLVFFAIAAWLALTPNKLVERIGRFLTPSLLVLIVFLFASFVMNGAVSVAAPQEAYATNAFLKGF